MDCLLPRSVESVSAGAPVDVGGAVTLADVARVAAGTAVMVGEEAALRMAASSEVMDRMVAERRRVYGVTTGYGPLAENHVQPELAEELQRNLVNHLCSGVGAPLPRDQVRALMCARASSLARGYSGIGADTFGRLLALLNRDVTPVVPEMGTVGASGDLTPLAHVALLLTGGGEALVDGVRMPGTAALAKAGLAPAAFRHKEALALVNGTSAMTGIAALNGVRARALLELALELAVVNAEVFGGHAEAFDPRFGVARPHPGQQWAHRRLTELTRDAPRLQAPVQPPEVLAPAGDGPVLHDRPMLQDPYTIRCVPQLLGAVMDQLEHHDRIVETELNSATDNPLVFAEDGHVLHGGNFFGQHVAYASDSLSLGVIGMAVHAERIVARVTDRRRNEGLPAFLTGGTVGLHSGLMGAQVTASALVAEMRSLAMPASIQSIPTNADNQDVVTMGTIAARRTAKQLELCAHVLAIEAMALTQAMDLRGGDGWSGCARSLHARVRTRFPALDADRPLSAEIGQLAADFLALPA
ncbi:MAG TPA: aromatic amino acid ammonia-lyase [Azospirillaceae bacterium]|nr:aromatic amino acid ammonia-lyase [Azospirillaceae bacterium]